MKSKFLLSIMLIFIVIDICCSQIQYQESMEVDKRKANAAGRVPLFAPTRCKNNELLYPGDQVDDWICDCAPAHLYYPETDDCYPAFRRGPCEKEQILVLGLNKIIPECISNPCKVDGQIPINNTCYEFDKPGPCPRKELSFVLGVDPKSLKVDCIKLSTANLGLTTRVGEDEDEIEKCARGTKRAVQGRCTS